VGIVADVLDGLGVFSGLPGARTVRLLLIISGDQRFEVQLRPESARMVSDAAGGLPVWQKARNLR